MSNNSFISGGITGFITQLATFPLDYYKTRQQLKTKINIPFKKSIYPISNIAFLQSSVTFPRVGIRFFSFNEYNKIIDNKLLAGFASGFTETILIYNITETIKTNAMKEVIPYEKAANNIYNKYGIKGFYNGLNWTLLRQSTTQGLSFYFHNFYSNILEKNINNENINNHLIAGTLAGMTTVLINNPIDVIKTRKQAGNKNIKIILQEIQNESYLVFYKGCLSRMIRLGMQQGLNFYIYDKIKNLATIEYNI